MPGNVPTPGYRAISKSCRLGQKSQVAPVYFTAAMGVISLDNRSYVMDDIEYCGGLSNYYDTAFPNSTLWESYYGLYLLAFVAGPNLLSDLFSSCISDYALCQFFTGPAGDTVTNISNSTDLLAANNVINPKDVDLVTGYNTLAAHMNEPTIWQNLLNTRLIASFHIPIFAGQNISGWVGNTSNDYSKVSQKFVIPPGYKYLVFLPTVGLWNNQVLGASAYEYNASVRCSLNLAV